jgi:hypothetical protein
MNEVLKFISHFNNSSEVVTSFTCGNCYWFSFILSGRFPEGDVMYDDVANHFGYMIDNEVYDITGVVTDKYNWKVWMEFALLDSALTKRLIRDCIDFE